MMLKKIILGVAAVGALGLAAAAVADGDEVASVAPSDSGFYVRGTLGYNFVGKDTKTLVVPAIPGVFSFFPKIGVNTEKSDGIAGGAAVGYDINQYFAVESGFNAYHSVMRSFSGDNSANGTNAVFSGNQKIKLYSFDLLGKATIPFKQFFAFVDGGGAYVHADYSKLPFQISNPGGTPVTLATTGSETKGYIRPVVGAGLGYNITNNVAVDVSYQRVFGKGSVNEANYLPNLNTVALGLTYKF